MYPPPLGRVQEEVEEASTATSQTPVLALFWCPPMRLHFLRRGPAGGRVRAVRHLRWYRKGAGVGTLTEFEVGELLERAGARPRGNRHDCPKCDARRTVTHTNEVFFCHRCHWRGNAVTLQKELGTYRRLSSVEYRDLRQNHARADRLARRFYEMIRARRLELYDSCRALGRILDGAHRRLQQNAEDVAAWSALALVYRHLRGVGAQLALLENAPMRERLAFLTAPEPESRRKVEEVLLAGGLVDERGRFVELAHS